MSLEVFGDEGDIGDGIDADYLYARNWESDPDCTKFWRKGEPEEVFTFEEAAKYEQERMWDTED